MNRSVLDLIVDGLYCHPQVSRLEDYPVSRRAEWFYENRLLDLHLPRRSGKTKAIVHSATDNDVVILNRPNIIEYIEGAGWRKPQNLFVYNVRIVQDIFNVLWGKTGERRIFMDELAPVQIETIVRGVCTMSVPIDGVAFISLCTRH